MGDRGMMGDEDRDADPWVLWTAVLVLVLAFVVVLIVVRQGRRAAVGMESARSLLDRRYAAGELERDEYLERRRDLEG